MPADAAHCNRARALTMNCDHGPVVAVAGRFVHLDPDRGDLLDVRLQIPRSSEDTEPIALAGFNGVLISPGAFVVDGARCQLRCWIVQRADSPLKRVRGVTTTKFRFPSGPLPGAGASINSGSVAAKHQGQLATNQRQRIWQQRPGGGYHEPRRHHASHRTRCIGRAWR